MELGRRGFLASLVGAVTWQYMPTGPMCWPAASSRLVTPDWILREVGRAYARSCAFSAVSNRAYYSVLEDYE